MNLNYIKNYLETKKDNITKEDIEALIKEITAYVGVGNKFNDLSSIMRVVNDYNLTYLTQVQEYEGFSTNDMKLLPKTCKRIASTSL